jgi:rhodanese-related sulfurtransferase
MREKGEKEMRHSEGFLKLVEDAKTRVREIDVHETQKRLQAGEARVIDTREDREWEAGRVAGAEHLGKGIIERDIEEVVPDKDAPIILYCGGGYRSALAADALQKMGYKNVFSMAGGWRAWNEANLPAE